jgi:uncharacterized protein (DUF736 family)
MQKTADSQLDFRVMTEGIKIGMGWINKDDMSNKEYVSLSNAASAFGPEKLYGNFGEAADSDYKDLFAVIWNRCEQTKAPRKICTGQSSLM